MRRGIAVVIAWGVLSTTIGLSAQTASPTPTPSPFSREAIHRALGVSSVAGARAVGAGQGKADWRRVQQRRLGSEIFLVFDNGVSVSRPLLEVDDTGLTVLKLDGALPFAVIETLRELSSSDPQRLIALSRSGSWSNTATKVSLTPDGVFMAGRKISDWSNLIVRIRKSDVAEVRTGRPGGSGRGFVGFLIGMVGGSAVAWAAADDPDNSLWPYVGMATGGVAGAIWFTRDARGLIYRR